MAPDPETAMEAPPRQPRHVRLVGIGASAGGVRALGDFFRALPNDPGLAFVVVMHLSPEHESQLAEVLQSDSSIPVRQVQGRTRIEENHVYVIPPNRNLELTDGHLELSEFSEVRGRRTPIDTFFRGLATVHPDGIGILLSGSGTDGVVGLKAIKEGGGIIMAQSPEEAEYDTMPRSAIATGLVDFVLPVRELARKVLELRSVKEAWRPPDPDGLEDGEAEALRAILADVQTRTGRDFRGYKKSTVLRRIGRRMQVHGSRDLEQYVGVLRADPAEPQALLEDLLISVTNFFRDPEAFAKLEHTVVPALFERGERPPEEIRVWVPGCATGEEAYSVAMLLAEQAERRGLVESVQVFASDLDAHALAYAREGLYPDAIAADVPPGRLERFFRREGAYYRVRKELRDLVLFAEHDLLRDPPFSRLDLLTCRNLLIYLERGLQERVAEVFRYALRPGGFLFLGSSESPPDHGGFQAVDKQHRIYRRTSEIEGPGPLPDMPLIPGPRRRSPGERIETVSPQQEVAAAAMHRQALEMHAPPSVLVDAGHNILHVSPGARRYMEFPAGSPSANILKVSRPELRVELRSVLYHALDKEGAARSGWVRVHIEGEVRQVEMYAAPAPVAEDLPLALITFLEAPVGADLEQAADGADASRRLGHVEAELETSRTRLRELVEASETHQEKLRAANEELQSINEEYRSTLEELETSREELQVSNEELRTVNEELNRKVAELASANDDLNNLMAATEVPTLFLDRRLRVQRYTPALQTIFNIMPVDEGRPLDHLTYRVDYPELRQDCQDVLDRLQPVEREIGNGSGHSWLVRITPYRSDEDRIGGVVVTFTDVSRVREAQRSVRESEERFRALVDATAEIVWSTNPEGVAVRDSPSWRGFTGQTEEEWLGLGSLDVVHPDDRERAAETWQTAVSERRPMDTEFRLWHARSQTWRLTSARAVPLRGADGNIREWVGMNTDITQERERERELLDAKAAAERAAEVKSQFLATMSHELRTPLTAVIGIADLMETEVVGPMNPKQKKHLQRIKRAAWHLVTIIEEVLTFSRSDAGRTELHRSTIDLAAIAREVVDILGLEAEEKGLRLTVHGAERPEFIFGDAGKIRQVVTNLVGNAIKFTDAGEVVVRLEPGQRDVALHVTDTGPGIAPDQHDEIFEPFTQADNSTTRSKGGVGLGLAVSLRLARLMNGEIELESTAGEGATFTFRLPREPEPGNGRE